MKNGKKFLSIILAMIMVFSTLVVGASAAHNAYKDSAITNYDGLDKPHLTTAQYASAAMDEVDRMLADEGDSMIINIYVATLDLTSLDKAMDSVHGLLTGDAMSTVGGLLGDLKNLNPHAFRPESQGGVRRTTAGKTDIDVINAIIEFLYDNRVLLSNFIRGKLDLGSVIPTLLGGDIAEFQDVNGLLKGMLYEKLHPGETVPNKKTLSFDSMLQELIDQKVLELIPEFAGKTNISTGTTYKFLDEACKVVYNTIALKALNGPAKKAIQEFCGVVFTPNGDGTFTEDRSNLNDIANLINIDFVLQPFSFTGETFVSQINNLVKNILDQIVKPEIFVWQAGDYTKFVDNATNLIKATLISTGDKFFANYFELATPEQIQAMTTEEVVVYAARAGINCSVPGMYIPDSVKTIRELGYYALKELLATNVPELDFSNMPKDSSDTLIIMGIDFAIFEIEAHLDMGLEYVYTMEGVDAQIKKAVQYVINNYGGLLSGIKFDTSKSGWDNLNTLVFSIIPSNWLPTQAGGDIKTFIFYIVHRLEAYDIDAIFELFQYRSDSELQKTPKQVVINLVTRVANIIFPNAIVPGATSVDTIAENLALADTIETILYDLYTYRASLLKSLLPILDEVLELTSLQEFKFPSYEYNHRVVDTGGILNFDIEVRNRSTGINTGYTDANGAFHQDKLYAYQFLSVKGTGSNLNNLKVTNPGTLAGGKRGKIAVTGGFTADTVLKIEVVYNVLTETGAPLTSTPISEYLYLYLTSSPSVENPDPKDSADAKYRFNVTSGNFSLVEEPHYIFASRPEDIAHIDVIAENAGPATTFVPTANLSKPIADQSGKQWILVNDKQYTLPGQVAQGDKTIKGRVEFQPFKMEEGYNLLTPEEKTAMWDYVIQKNSTRVGTPALSYAPGIKTANGATVTDAQFKLYLYKECGLGGLVNGELNAIRQKADYGASEWANYENAMSAAIEAVYSPFEAGTGFTNKRTGKAVKYEPAYTDLVAAVEALEASNTNTGVTSTQEIINSYTPDNTGIEYDSPDYTYSSASDYIAYTYYRYRGERKVAQRMVDAATIPNEVTGEVTIPDSLTVAYVNHRVSLYGSRLLPVTANKSHLAAELATSLRPNISNASDWEAASWANYQRALAFATAVNNDSSASLKQSKVNTAYEQLLEAEKKLIKAGGVTPPPADKPTYEPVCPSDSTIVPAIYEASDGTKILTGMFPEGDYTNDAYFTCKGCHVEAEPNAGGVVSTGAKLNIVDDATGKVIDTYLVCVTGDLNGDALVADNFDFATAKNYTQGFTGIGEAEFYAAEVTKDDLVDGFDTNSLKGAVQALAVVDCANRIVK